MSYPVPPGYATTTRAVEHYNYGIVQRFTFMALFWGGGGLLVGVYLAALLIWPDLAEGWPALSFGRLVPIHTTLLLFGFAGCLVFAFSYYIVQRTCQVRLASDLVANFTFWGWQLALGGGVITLLLGYGQARSYAELEWPLDLLMESVWVAALGLYVATLHRRTQAPVYVANWFFLATLLGMVLFHGINNLAVPVNQFNWKAYSFFAGVQDALIQGWYSHNVINFLLITAFLGILYYLAPKQTGRPIYSYRLSILHFWALIFVQVWIGPQHLHWTALPDWTSSLGVGFAILLVTVSWAGIINGFMTLTTDWQRLRSDPVWLFLLTALVSYALATLEGGLLALRSISAFTQGTDWPIAHVHNIGMGWAGLLGFGAIYHLLPRLWSTRFYSSKLIYLHYGLAIVGLLLHTLALWGASIIQGHYLTQQDEYGNLAYGFLQSQILLAIPYWVRWAGGLLFFTGLLIMVINIAMTALGVRRQRLAIEQRIATRLAARGGVSHVGRTI